MATPTTPPAKRIPTTTPSYTPEWGGSTAPPPFDINALMGLLFSGQQNAQAGRLTAQEHFQHPGGTLVGSGGRADYTPPTSGGWGSGMKTDWQDAATRGAGLPGGEIGTSRLAANEANHQPGMLDFSGNRLADLTNPTPVPTPYVPAWSPTPGVSPGPAQPNPARIFTPPIMQRGFGAGRPQQALA